jgi:hypothetical protein
MFFYFLIILQNYTIVLKFIRFDNQPPCATAAAVSHGGCPTGVKVSRRGPRRLRPIRRVLRRQGLCNRRGLRLGMKTDLIQTDIADTDTDNFSFSN